MPAKPTLDHLSPPIRAELTAKILANRGRNHQQIADWLLEQHGVEVSKMAEWRFAQKTLLKHYGLLQLDVPIDAITANIAALDLLGAYLVQREMINRRIDKLLASLMQDIDQPEAKP